MERSRHEIETAQIKTSIDHGFPELNKPVLDARGGTTGLSTPGRQGCEELKVALLARVPFVGLQGLPRRSLGDRGRAVAGLRYAPCPRRRPFGPTVFTGNDHSGDDVVLQGWVRAIMWIVIAIVVVLVAGRSFISRPEAAQSPVEPVLGPA
jgi:hypothetical protein